MTSRIHAQGAHPLNELVERNAAISVGVSALELDARELQVRLRERAAVAEERLPDLQPFLALDEARVVRVVLLEQLRGGLGCLGLVRTSERATLVWRQGESSHTRNALALER